MENGQTEGDSGEIPEVLEDVFPIVPDTFVDPQPTASPNVYVIENQVRHPTSSVTDINPAANHYHNSSEICQHSGHDRNVMLSGIACIPDLRQVSEITSREVCDSGSFSALDSSTVSDLRNSDVGVYENVTYGHRPVEDAYLPKMFSDCRESNDIA